MATLLTTRKMHPALAKRVEASVSGRRTQGAAPPWRARVVALVRLIVVAVVVAVTATVVLHKRHVRERFERTRAELLETLHAQTASLPAGGENYVDRAGAWLGKAAGIYEGDYVAPELRKPGTLAARLSHSMVYVRGPLDGLTHPDGVIEAAVASYKDSLLYCLLDPPAHRNEKELLVKVRIARGGGAPVQEHAGNVVRLSDAVLGLPFLKPEWGERAGSMVDVESLHQLRSQLEKAPIERAKFAARAELLLYALDEPNEPGGVTEIDGEHDHFVRVGVVDAKSGGVLLRLRRRVDPNWISLEKRSQYSHDLDSCGLALDVLDAAAQP